MPGIVQQAVNYGARMSKRISAISFKFFLILKTLLHVKSEKM